MSPDGETTGSASDKAPKMITRSLLLLILCLACVAPALAQTALVSGTQPVSLGMSLRGNELCLDIGVAVAGSVSVYCPIAPGLMRFSGLTAPVEASYDRQRQILQLNLPPGHYQVTIRSLP